MTAEDKKPPQRKKASYTFWFDAETSRQYAIESVDGQTATITAHTSDATLPALEPGQIVYAFSDTHSVVTVVQHAGSLEKRIPAVRTQIVSLRAQADGGLEQIGEPVEALYDFTSRVHQSTVNGISQISIPFTLLASSRQALEQAGLDPSKIAVFTQYLPIDHPGFGSDGDARLFLSALRLPPHHPGSGRADTARFDIEVKMSQEHISAAFNRKQRSRSGQFTVPDGVIEGFLNDYGVDLTELARKGELEPTVGRDGLVHLARVAMHKRTDASVTFIGPSGCGKTALFGALAQEYVSNPQTEDEEDARIVSLDLGKLAAEKSQPGQAAAILKMFIKGVTERKGYLAGRKLILAFDELADQMDVKLFIEDVGPKLKPLLTAAGVSVVATMTDDDWAKFSRDPQMARRFASLPVTPLSNAELKLALLAQLPAEDAHHDMAESMTGRQLDFIIEKTNQTLLDQAQPNKALQAIRYAYGAARYRGSKTVEDTDIIEAISRMTGQSVEFVANDEGEKLETLAPMLKERLFGQDEAITTVSGELIAAHSGLQNPNRPRGVFLFLGPTGVGKTEMCNLIGEHLGLPVHRFDMTEFMEEHAVAKLIGSPPGYIGYNDGGRLTNTVLKTPRCIVLLDEFEKAHEKLQNILLGIYDAGNLTDGQNRTVDFRNVVFVMTSNAGARDAESARNKPKIGPKAKETPDVSDAFNAAVKKAFSPEFRARLDAVVVFKSLTEDIVDQIMGGQLKILSNRLGSASGVGLEGVSLVVSEDACKQIREQGYNLEQGARNLKKTVDNAVGKALAIWLIANRGANKKALEAFAKENGPTHLVIDSIGDGFSPRWVKAPAGNDNVANAPQTQIVPVKKPGLG